MPAQYGARYSGVYGGIYGQNTDEGGGGIVTRDATSLKVLPQSAGQWSTLLAGSGLSVPDHLWLLQEPAVPTADSIGVAPLDQNLAANFQQAVAGWSAKGIGFLVTGGGSLVTNAATPNLLPDLNNTSVLLLTFQALVGSNGASNSVLLVGQGGTESKNVVVQYDGTTNHYVLTDGTNTTQGTINHGAGVVRQLLRYNQTANTVDLFVDGEKISKTFVRPAPASKAGVWLGQAYGTWTPSVTTIYMAMWVGPGAEMSDAQIANLYTLLQS